MTDEHGSDMPHETGDHEQVAGEAEAWTGEPPVDDFHAGEEGATVSEETEHEHEHTEEDASAGHVTGHKKSMTLPIAAGGGALLFLVAVLYWQFGMSSGPVSPTTNQAPNWKLTSSSPNANLATMPLPHITPGAGNAAAPSPLPTQSTDAATPPSPNDAVAPTSALAPATDAAAAPSTPMTAPATTPPPVAGVVPVTTAPSATADAEIAALSARVEDLQKSLNQATQQLSQISATAGANPVIDERLNKIEQKLMQLQHGSSSEDASETAAAKSSGRTYAHKNHAKKRTTKSAKTSHKAGVIRVRDEEEILAPHWVLRAATPTEAWVATDETSAELRHVQVGDKLPGVGTVKAIHQNGDGWMIEGSQATVH